MSWRLANRFLIAAGPSAPLAYSGILTLASGASDNSRAKAFRDGQIEMIAWVLSSPAAMAWIVFVVFLWAAAVWGTDCMDRKEQKRALSLDALATRAEACSQGIIRTIVLHKQREAIASDHAWKNKGQRDFFVGSASLMGDYAVLYSSEALSILKAAERRNIPLDRYAISSAENPTNPLGVEEVSRHLAVLADRIKSHDY